MILSALLGLALLATEPATVGGEATGVAGTVAAMLARADSAYFSGRDDDARAAYRVVLASEPLSVRANHRLGLLLVRVNQLDSAIVLLGRARTVEPDDAGLLTDEARLLSWAGRLPESIADYERLLALDPGSRDGRLGRARVLGWAGRYAAADSGYAAMLAADPHDLEALTARAQCDAWRGQTQLAEARYRTALSMDRDYVEALVGLARLLNGQGRPRAADLQLSRALSLDPANHAATTLSRQVRAARRPQVETGFSLSRDSDRNVAALRTMSASFAVADGVRGVVALGSLGASDPVRDAGRMSGEVGLDAARGAAQLTLAAGARLLDPAAGPARHVPTYRSSLALRASPRLSLGAGFAHSALDESALLIGTGPRQDELQANLDAELAGGLALSAGGGAAWLSDGNHRSSALAALMHPLGRLGSAGVLGRVLAYQRHGAGYFSPDRFALAEARAALAHTHHAWTGRLNGGIGAQQVGAHAATQLAWRAAAEGQYGWATLDRVVVSIGASNSAASSTTGAYRYLTAAVALRIGS